MTRQFIEKPAISLAIRFQLGLAFFAFILIGMSDGAVGVLIPSIRAHYTVDKGTVSLIFLFSTLGYLISAMNSGFLVNKLGTRNYMLLGTFSFILSLGSLSLTPPFPLFAVMLFPLGFGIAVIDSGLNAYVAAQPNSTAQLNYLHAFYGIGALLGPAIASAMIAGRFPWNSVYLVLLVLCVLVSLGMLLIFKNERARHTEATSDAGSQLGSILKIRLFWFLALFLLFYVGIEVVLGNWSFSFLTEDRGEQELIAGWAVSAYWLGLTLGRVSLGHVAQRFGERLTIQWCVIGTALGVLIAWLVPVSIISAAGLCLTGFCLGPIFPTAIALISRGKNAARTAAAIGFLISFACMGGALFPWTAGNLAEQLGLWSIMPYVIILTVIMLVFWYLTQYSIRRDESQQDAA